MGPLTEAELVQRVGASMQVKKYAQAIDRESAEEKLAAHADVETPAAAQSAGEPGWLSRVGRVLSSPRVQSVLTSIVRTAAVAVTTKVTRDVLGVRRERTTRRS